MNYRIDIENCIEYIEKHVKKDLTVKEIASYAGYSVFHFCRIFSLCKGMTVMEYIRSRRLSLAAVDLFHEQKIIDIAIEYGFETPSGFSKAFHRVYGYSPTQYVARLASYQNIKTLNIGGLIMNPKIISKPAFKVAGYGIKTNIAGTSYTKDIASFWSNYDGENLETKMYAILNPPKHGEVGLCVPSSNNSYVTYLLGVIVEDYSKVTDDMITVDVPEALYAVFTTPPVDSTKDENQNEFSQAIKATWKYIFEDWFEDSGYIYDENKLDFEFYDERCHFKPDTVMDIYVPVKKIQ